MLVSSSACASGLWYGVFNDRFLLVALAGHRLLSKYMMPRLGLARTSNTDEIDWHLIRKHPILGGAYCNLIETDTVRARSYEQN